ncbi:MAG TPA: ATP-binding protein [Kofleriaceae bacterium]|nr:ATP-binding protein [Kofleriaceae bacterium]
MAKRPQVWIVDDSPTEALITERSLGHDYEFARFADGSLVVEHLATAADLPDVLILDWVMPGMAGDEVCRFLRSTPRTRHIPIILVTASRVETADIVEGLASGANDYVARPFAAQELRARVDAVIRASQLRAIANHERRRLDTVNRIGRAVLAAGASTDDILEKLATGLTSGLCDGCSILLLPGPFPPTAIAHHRADPTGQALAAIAMLTDPTVHTFESTDEARRTLPPIYQPYIERFGLRGLAVLPLPSSGPVQGVVTVTRDGHSAPFDPEDITTIETCVEYAALAVQTAVLFGIERTAYAQLYSVLDQLPIAIVATDAHAQPTLINAAATALIAQSQPATADPARVELPAWTQPDRSTIGHGAWLRDHTLTTRHPAQAEFQLASRAGGPRTVLVSAVPLLNGRGELAGAVTALQDVSIERAVTIEREAIAKFQQQLIGIVGHDLRNPLAAISTGLSILDEVAKAQPAIGSVVRRLESSTQRMTRIVDQLLDVTRARLGGGIPMERRETELLPIAKAAIDELVLAYPTTPFELLRAAPVAGYWDPDRLSQVLSNLMSNAAQYGRDRTPVQLEVGQVDDLATMTVRNTNRNGPIPPELIDVLFDPYRRGRGEAKHHTGLGLGLYIVHEIVTAHGGRIDVESHDDLTQFRVVLPRRADV